MSVTSLPADTLPEAAWVQMQIFRRMSAGQRLRLALEMGDTVRALVADGIRSRHREFTEEQVRSATIRIYLGDESIRGPSSTMTTQQEFLASIAGLLQAAAIDFMVSGSVGSSFHGQPRATNDVDLVIDPTPDQLERFLSLVGDRYYVSASAARDALRQRSLFNLIDFSGGWKADLIVRKDRPYSVEELRRKKIETLQGIFLPVASAEDIILSKLEWNKITSSERQTGDALNVATTQWPKLDRDYLRMWAAALGIADSLEEVLSAAEMSQSPPGPAGP